MKHTASPRVFLVIDFIPEIANKLHLLGGLASLIVFILYWKGVAKLKRKLN
jgi:hypothetical protein